MNDTDHPQLPNVAELAGMSDQELRERHDAQVAHASETGEPVSDVYLGELAVRMAELRDERLMRILLAVLAVSAATLVMMLLFFIVAL